jgi:hypothetical protein
MIGEQHGGDGDGHLLRQFDDGQMIQGTGHLFSPKAVGTAPYLYGYYLPHSPAQAAKNAQGYKNTSST